MHLRRTVTVQNRTPFIRHCSLTNGVRFTFTGDYRKDQVRLILSIRSSSSLVKDVFSIAFILSMICDGFDAPIKTELTMPSFRTHASAISARVWFLSFAISESARTFLSFSSVIALTDRNLPSVITLLSLGMPFRYLSVSRPCASGLKAIIPLFSLAAVLFRPLFSIVLSNIEYLF